VWFGAGDRLVAESGICTPKPPPRPRNHHLRNLGYGRDHHPDPDPVRRFPSRTTPRAPSTPILPPIVPQLPPFRDTFRHVQSGVCLGKPYSRTPETWSKSVTFVPLLVNFWGPNCQLYETIDKETGLGSPKVSVSDQNLGRKSTFVWGFPYQRPPGTPNFGQETQNLGRK